MEYKVNIREMKKADVPQLLEALGKAFATTPGWLAVFRDDPVIARRIQIGFEVVFKYLPVNIFIAELDGRVVGGMWIAKWPACQAHPSLKMGISMVVKFGGLGPLIRTVKWLVAWGKHDPPKPHWHLKGLGVAPDFQGKGIGSQMVKFYYDIVDRDMIEAYLETGPDNVRFYERFGFKVVGEEIINGSKNCYMLRPAKSDK